MHRERVENALIRPSYLSPVNTAVMYLIYVYDLQDAYRSKGKDLEGKDGLNAANCFIPELFLNFFSQFVTLECCWILMYSL